MVGVKRRRLSEEVTEQIQPTPRDQVDAIKDGVELKTLGNDDPHNGRSLFVRSLSTTTTSEDLADFFSQSYPVKHATVVLDKATGGSKGFGFVTFADEHDAIVAQTTLNGTRLQGRCVRLDFAQSRHRRAGDEDFQIVQREARKSRARETPSLPKLIVRNLPWTIKREAQLADLFREFGNIKYVNFPKKETGLSPGFGFVVFVKQKSAEKAIEAINGKKLHGRSLAVDWAVDKHTWEGLRSEQDKMADGHEDEKFIQAKNLTHEQTEIPGSSTSGEDSTRDIEHSISRSPDQVHSASIEPGALQAERLSSTLFVRNVPFTATDQTLYEHFAVFGRLQSAKIVKDVSSGQSKGTAFVRFKEPEAVEVCLREALETNEPGHQTDRSKSSILEDSSRDPSGRLTLDGRRLGIFRAVDRSEAVRLSVKNDENRNDSVGDRRRLYLLNEGQISANGLSQTKVSPAELSIREQNIDQRRMLLNKDPSLLLSLTRLSIRNLPKHFTAKALKALAREAVLGFAKDVKTGLRKPLSKEENARGGHEMRLAEKERKAKGKGIVRQAKVIFESRDGNKVSENTGIGRSRGYGFIEYTSHRWALMGLRWLNGYHAQESDLHSGPKLVASASKTSGVKRRLIVEFAIENAQVVARRQHREVVQSLHTPISKEPSRKRHKTHVFDGVVAEGEAAIIHGRPPSLIQAGQVSASGKVLQDHRVHSVIGRKRMARKAKRRA